MVYKEEELLDSIRTQIDNEGLSELNFKRAIKVEHKKKLGEEDDRLVVSLDVSAGSHFQTG